MANRMQQFDFAERLFENALELDPSDPYIILNAIEEYYEPSEQWDKIIYLFSILPVVDPNHEFMAEARSLRQSILETIQETEATNQQIYDLYHIPDYSSPMEKGELVDYFGRDIHQHSPINDGFNRYGYQHAKLIDRENDHKLKQFNFNVDDRLNVEKIPVASFYKNIPENLLENYSNTNWYELPIMKEWMEKVPNEHAGESIDWKSMRNDKGNLEVPYSAVFDKHDSIKVSMKDLENLRVLLAKEYTTVPTAMKEGMKDQEHAYEMKTQEQLIKEIRKNIGEAYFDWSFIDNDLQFPVEKEDFALSHLLNDSLKRYSFDFMGKKKDN